jgi:ribosomal RNA assembly protein
VEQKTYLKIPLERIGVLVGPKGKVKRRIENAFGVTLIIDSKSGAVEVYLNPGAEVTAVFEVQNIVKAIGRGFSPKRAERLVDEDYDLAVIELTEYVGRSKNAISRVKGRIIGKEGRSRRLLEELTGTMISVYGQTVAIIGKFDELHITREAVLMLVKGAFHKTVWNFLYNHRRKMRKKRLELWEETPEPKRLSEARVK